MTHQTINAVENGQCEGTSPCRGLLQAVAHRKFRPSVLTTGESVLLLELGQGHGTVVNFCPFCGAEIRFIENQTQAIVNKTLRGIGLR